MARNNPEIMHVLDPTYNWQFPTADCNKLWDNIKVFHGNAQRFNQFEPELMTTFVENIWFRFAEKSLMHYGIYNASSSLDDRCARRFEFAVSDKRTAYSCKQRHAIDTDATKVDVGIVLSLGDDPVRITELRTSLNSLFYFRSCPIHFHAIVKDDLSLSAFAQWVSDNKPEHAEFSYYIDPTNVIQRGFRSHFAGIKVVPDSVLPTSVDRVVIADFDLIWAADICD
eukprot:jgi/Hompol1/3074/HPOL_006322-RA